MTPYYHEKGITIYLGDCRDILPAIDKVDLVLTDPPYGIAEPVGKNKKHGWLATSKYGAIEWDDAPVSDSLIKTIIENAKHAIIFGGNYYRLEPSACWLVWDKYQSSDFADCELAWTNLKKAARMKRHRWSGMLQENMADKEHRYHPTQKPLNVMTWCISQAPKSVRTILDPFMGSGTTLVAAKLLGLEAIGIEREKKYCDIAIKRLAQEVLPFQKKLT